MMLSLIRRDHAFRSVLVWSSAGLLLGAVSVALAREAAASGDAGYGRHYALATMLWSVVVLYLIYADATARATRFDLPLPIRPARLWLTRVVSLSLGVIAILGVGLGCAAAGGFVSGVGPAVVRSFLLSAAHAGAALALGIALVQGYRPGLYRAEHGASTVLAVIIIALVDIVILLAQVAAGPWAAAVVLAAALALATRTYHRLPRAFVVARCSDAAGGRQAAPIVWDGEDEGSLWVRDGAATGSGAVHRALLQLFARHWAAWLFGGMLAFLGFYLAGAWPDGLSGPLYVAVAWSILNGPLLFAMARLHMIDHLPVSRRLVFAYMVLPALAVLMLGHLGGAVVGRSVQDEWTWKLLTRDACCPQKRVPYEFLDVSMSGTPPVLSSPWGEEHEPWRTRVTGNSRAVLYRRFDTPADASVEFNAHQVRRALEWGLRDTGVAARVEREYLRRANELGVSVWDDWYLLMESDPLRTTRHEESIPLMFTLVGVPWFLFVAFFMWAGRGTTALRRRAPGMVIAAVVITVTTTLLVSASLGWVDTWKLTALAWVVLRRAAEAVPGGTGLLWLCSLALVGAAYLVAERQFLRSEAVLKHVTE